MTAQVIDRQVVEIFKRRKEYGNQWCFVAMVERGNLIVSVSIPNASFDRILEEIYVHTVSMFY